MTWRETKEMVLFLGTGILLPMIAAAALVYIVALTLSCGEPQVKDTLLTPVMEVVYNEGGRVSIANRTESYSGFTTHWIITAPVSIEYAHSEGPTYCIIEGPVGTEFQVELEVTNHAGTAVAYRQVILEE